ncbi:hypothetical protein GCWU000324_01438 [Kingella oralis ATCC 51147]|uniref:Uncharacterized protein n=1 Tax=Kingella oralis ATCC 51147 TaxID=629741 RepID=C4GH19_9NEIS|nr:hypothetical protein GCWU000324_01438 [Kingella oralis ATCC 51147]
MTSQNGNKKLQNAHRQPEKATQLNHSLHSPTPSFIINRISTPPNKGKPNGRFQQNLRRGRRG